MIDFLSIRIADFLCRKGIIKAEDKELYIYGYQLLISSFIGILLTLILGIAFGKLFETSLYLVIFISTRQRCGGYHAKHFLTCILSFLSSYLMVMLLESYLLQMDYVLYCILMELIYLITVIRFAPMEHKNKPLSQEVKLINRKKSIQYSVIWITLSIPAYFLLSEMAIIIALTLVTIASFMLLETILKEVNEIEE